MNSLCLLFGNENSVHLCCCKFVRAYIITSIKYSEIEQKLLRLKERRMELVMDRLECSPHFWWLLYLGNLLVWRIRILCLPFFVVLISFLNCPGGLILLKSNMHPSQLHSGSSCRHYILLIKRNQKFLSFGIIWNHDCTNFFHFLSLANVKAPMFTVKLF